MDSCEKRYSAITGWSNDAIRRPGHRGELKAAMLPEQSSRWQGVQRSVRVSETALKSFAQRNQN